MALPSAVQKQADAADRMIADQAQQRNPAQAAPEPTVPPVTTETPAIDLPASEQPKPVPKQAQQHDEGTAAYWQNRFNVVQGKYNAEVPRLTQQVADLRTQVATLSAAPAQPSADAAELHRLSQENARLQQQIQQATASQTVPANEAAARAQYGDDIFDTVKHMIEQRTKPLEQTVQQNREDAGEAAHAARSTALASVLQGHGLDFNQMNRDPGFLTWLAEIEPLSGQTRNKLLNAAFGSGQINRAALFFTEYSGGQRQTDSRANPKPDLAAHVLVGSETPADQNRDTPQTRVWSDAEVKDFYRNEARYDPKEFARLEQELFAVLQQRGG